MARLNRFLLVSDNGKADALLHGLLANQGAQPELVPAGDIGAAELALTNSAFAALLLDIAVCRGRAAQVLRRLTSVPGETPILLIAHATDIATAAEALRHGAQDYILWSSLDAATLKHRLQFCIDRFWQERDTRRRLRETEKLTSRFQSLVHDTADAILVLKENGLVKFANPAAGALFGRDPASLVGSDPGIPLDGSGTMEVEITQRGGAESVVDVRIIKTFWDDGPVLLATLRDISQRKRAERALLEAKHEADLANETKSRFLAHMSHELRTPLNSILGFTEMMQRGLFGEIGNPRYAGYLETIRYSATHLLTLINDLLDLSKIEAGREELDESVVDMRELLRTAVDAEQPTACQHGVVLSCDICQHPRLLWADRVKLSQIVLNLLSNAIKFTPEGGRVTLCGRAASGGGYEIAVTDTGIGIEEDDIPQAMGSFGQIRNPYACKADRGTGLGLPIARSLAELHQGSLQLASRRGVGTEVTVRLPAGRLVKQVARPLLPLTADDRGRKLS